MITEQEKIRRKEIIDFARGNVRYEGVILSEAVESINQKYINGDIDKSPSPEQPSSNKEPPSINKKKDGLGY